MRRTNRRWRVCHRGLTERWSWRESGSGGGPGPSGLAPSHACAWRLAHPTRPTWTRCSSRSIVCVLSTAHAAPARCRRRCLQRWVAEWPALAWPALPIAAPVDLPIALLPHQLSPALAVVRGAATRLLLADAVGQGKTVEAGLILRELAARGAADRVLVLTPLTLRDQWRDGTRLALSARGRGRSTAPHCARATARRRPASVRSRRRAFC